MECLAQDPKTLQDEIAANTESILSPHAHSLLDFFDTLAAQVIDPQAIL